MSDDELPTVIPTDHILKSDGLFTRALMGAFQDRGFILIVFPQGAKQGDGMEYVTNCTPETVDLILGHHRGGDAGQG